MTSIEKLLINNESYIRAFFDGIPLPVYVFQKKNRDFICIDHNTTALYEDKSGFKIKLGTKASRSFISHPEIIKHLKKCSDQQSCFSHDIEIVSKHSQSKFFHLKYGYVSSDLVLLHIEDISEKSLITFKLKESEAELKKLNKKLEERVKEGETLFQQIIETIPDIFFIVSEKGIIVDFIGDEEELFLPSEEFLGRSILEILPQEISIPLFKKIKTTIETKGITSHEYSLPMKNELKYFKIQNLYLTTDKIACFIHDITEWKKNELKLIKQRQKYEKLISNIPDAIYYTIHKDNITRIFMSKRWEDWTGLSCEELMENPFIWVKSIHPSDLKRVIHKYYIASKNREEYTIEYRIVHKTSGKITHIRDHGKAIRDMRETITRYDGILRDITNEKLILEELEINERRYHLILENLNELIYIINQNLEVEYFNEKVFEKLLGFDKRDIIDHNPLEYIHPEDYNKALNAVKKGIINSEGRSNLRIRDKENRYHHHELIGKLFTDYDDLQKALIISRDVSDQIEIEEKMKASERKYRIIAENAIDVIGIINDKYVIEYVNKIPLKKVAGYDLRDVLGKQGLDFVHPDDREKALRSLLKGKKTGEDKSLIRFRHKDGHYIWIDSGGSVFRDKDGNLKGIIILRDVSERKEIEEMLEESEEKYRLISENSSDLIRVLDHKLKIRYINEQTHLKLLGYSAEELIGKSGILFIHPDEKDELSDFIKRLIKEGEARREGRLLNKNGDWNWMDIWAKLVPVGDKKWNGIVVMRDISESKEYENKLKISEERYRLISENANDMIAVITEDLKLEYTNSKPLKRILGYNIEEILGKNLVKFIHPEDIQLALDALRKGTKKGYNKIQLRFKHKSGTYRWLEIGGQAFKDPRGEYKGIIISRDITEQKKSMEKIKESEKTIRKFIESSYDGIVLTDENGFIIEWNEALEIITGLTKENALNKPIWEIINSTLPKFLKNDSLKSAIETEYRNALMGKHRAWLNRIRDVKLERPNKELRTIQQLSFTMETVLGNRLGAICRDVTDIKKYQDNIAKSEKEYREAYDRANFYKDLFAHDINNILQIINSSAEILQIIVEETHDYPKIPDLAKKIRKQVSRGAKLVNDVHTLSELEKENTKLVPVNIYPLLKESIKINKKTYEDKKINIKLNSDYMEIVVNADNYLKQVFDNLLINSIKYNDNEQIDIQIRISDFQDKSNNFVKLEFTDNGIGIKDDHKEEIFKKGYRESKGTKGMGIGLALVKKILNLYNSKIWVENRVKEDYTQGSNFVILIPSSNPLKK